MAILKGDALHKVYAEDDDAQEIDESERVGRDSWVRGRQEMEKNIKTFHARVLARAAHGGTSFSEWEYQIELEGMGSLMIAQVAVRRWLGGKVVRERFYHK